MNSTLIILLIYFALMLAIAFYFSRKTSIEDYFINKRKTSLWLMTFSTISTVIGASATISVVSEVYNSGISYGLALILSFTIGIFILGLVSTRMKIVGDKYQAQSIADIFYKRFNRKNKNLVGVLQLFVLIGWIAVNLAGLSAISSIVLDVNYSLAIWISILITILYSTIGGLKVDIITDFIQFWIILIPFVLMTFIGYFEIGNLNNLISKLPEGHLNPLAFGGIAWFLGTIILSGFIYLGTAYHWQRTLSAKSEKIAKKSYFLAIPFLLVIGLMVIFFGLLASVLLKDISQDFAIFNLMSRLLPKSFAGLGFAAILAAIMSSVDSSLVAGSTIIYKTVFKEDSFNGKKKMLFARITTASFGVLAGLLVLAVPSIVSLSLLVSYMALVFVPAIFAVLYSEKTSSNASFYSILIGFISLIILFPILGKNAFIIPVISAILMILFYDKILKLFKK
ncbi:MAG: sodium:solute symporter family protein [Patescibacteria group bacterium]|nr:sodium:solute symporter family protein [Patescibacteria group bacterium]